MNRYKTIKLKSAEEIDETLSSIELTHDTLYATYKGKPISTSTELYSIAGTEVEVLDTSARTHGFDYALLYQDTSTNSYPYIYIMKEWTEDISKEVVCEVLQDTVKTK